MTITCTSTILVVKLQTNQSTEVLRSLKLDSVSSTQILQSKGWLMVKQQITKCQILTSRKNIIKSLKTLEKMAPILRSIEKLEILAQFRKSFSRDLLSFIYQDTGLISTHSRIQQNLAHRVASNSQLKIKMILEYQISLPMTQT